MTRRSGRRPPPLAAVLLVVAAGAAAAFEVPYLGGRVNDHAGMIGSEARGRLEAKLRSHEERTGVQVAILTVESLEGESIEDVSMRVAETWKLGRKGKDDGVLLLVARRERKMRIEVGYGLEGVLTDAIGRRILDERIGPRFRAGDYAGGFDAGVDAVVGVLEGRGLPEARSGRSRTDPRARVLALAIFAIVVARMLFLVASRRSRRVRRFLSRHPAIAVLAAPRRGGRGSGFRLGGGGFSGGGGGFGGGGASGGW